MPTHFDIEKLIESGFINNELDYERALIADRKLRLLSKDNAYFKTLRQQLRDIIEVYENTAWSNVNDITEQRWPDNEKNERIAESERLFIERRKSGIRKQLKELDLNQEDLAFLLGHKSKTHMSELMNGIKPFTLKDLIIINRLLHIDMAKLIPVYLSREDQLKVNNAIKLSGKPQVKLSDKIPVPA